MKTDRELLELAAKAAGHCVAACCDGKYWKTETPESEGIEHWNPLESDGDALRLAVKLRLECMYEATELGPCHCQFWIAGEGFKQVTEHLNDDPYAATRRAITRAAAAIGEGMK